jgi:AcrR family transcriptional regulator
MTLYDHIEVDVGVDFDATCLLAGRGGDGRSVAEWPFAPLEIDALTRSPSHLTIEQRMGGASLERRAEIGRERRDRTRTLLMTSAARLVAERGAEGVTIDDFIKAAGVARGTFYNYFNCRDQLLEALSRHVGLTPLIEIRKQLRGDPDPASRLATALRLAVHRSVGDPIWGWLLVRITSGSTLNEEDRAFPLADIKVGAKTGRFWVGDPEVCCDYYVGVAVMAMKAVMLAQRPPDYAEQCAYMILLGLGLPASEARGIAWRPLPPKAD